MHNSSSATTYIDETAFLHLVVITEATIDEDRRLSFSWTQAAFEVDDYFIQVSTTPIQCTATVPTIASSTGLMVTFMTDPLEEFSSISAIVTARSNTKDETSTPSVVQTPSSCMCVCR